MRVISVRKLREFWTEHPQAKGPLQAWHTEAKKANWTGPADIKALYRRADIIAGNRVIFDIGGNKFRLVVHLRYEFRIAYIKFVGTHVDYDKINPATVSD